MFPLLFSYQGDVPGFDFVAVLDKILSAENGIWALVVITVVWIYSRKQAEKKEPFWFRNGGMDHIKLVANEILKEAITEQQKSFAKYPQENAETLAQVQVEILRIGVTLNWLQEQHHKYDEGWPEMVKNQAKATENMGVLVGAVDGFQRDNQGISSQLNRCSEHLTEQTRVLKAVVREMNNTRACPYRPADAQAITEELERKRKADAHTRAEDLGIDPEEIKG